MLVGIFCSRATTKKKRHIAQPPKRQPYSVLPHGRFCSLFLHQKSCYKKSDRTEILAMTPRAILLSAAAQLYGLIWWGGSLLHNERVMVIFFGGGYVSTRISKSPVLVRALPVSERVPVLVRAYARFSTGFAFSARLFGGQSRFDPADNACQNKIERGAP